MNFSRGNAARFRAPLKLSWKRVEDYTHELIVSGRYMEEAEVWHVPAQERMELASKIYFFFRDEYGTMPEEPELRMSSFPDSQQALAEMLSNPEGIDKILYHIKRLSTRKLYDEFGQLHYCVDETLRRRLETKLITKILKFKPVPYGTDQSEESSN